MRDWGRRAGGLAFTVVLAGGLAGWSAPGAGAAGDQPTPGARSLRRLADDVRAATNAPGAVVGFQRGRAEPVLVARGTRDRRDGGPIETDDPYVTASVSKAFTAAVVLALVNEGTMKLDDPVVRYVPGWDRRITIRHLLNHSSGLRSWGNKDDDDTVRDALETPDLSRRFTMAESLEPVRAAPLLATPGTATHYSNANTLLAGMVIESVTGGTLAAAYRQHVLDPFHLDSTAYVPQETPPRPPIPGVLYVGDNETELDTSQYPQESFLTLGGPSVAVVSDATDVLRLARALLRDSFPTRRLARAARRIDDGGAGLGIIGFTRSGYCIFDGCPAGKAFPRIGFAGNAPGTSVRVVHDPKLDTTVYVYANSNQRGKLDPFVIRLFDQLK